MSTELVNPDIDRVDAVNGPATGIPFLLFKSADGAPAEAPAEETVEKSAEPAEPAAEEAVEKAAEPEAQAEPAEAAEEPLAKSEEAPDDLAKAHVLKSLAFDLKKGAVASIPTGLLELLGEVVAAYQQVVETGDTAPESPADVETPAEAPAAAPAEAPVEAAAPAAPEEEEAPAAPEAPVAQEEAEALEEAAAPVEDELVDDAEKAAEPEPAPAEEPPAAPAPAAPAKAPAVPKAPAPAPAEEPEEEAKKPAFAKSMEALILEAVAKATAPLLEANEELTKRLEKVEATPVDSGPFLAGQTPGNGGIPSLRGQDVGGAAEGLMKSAAPQPPSGMDALAAGLKSTWFGQ